MSIKINKSSPDAKLVVKNLEDLTAKILVLETPIEGDTDNEVQRFRREFNIPLDRYTWYEKLAEDKDKFERYRRRLQDLANRFNFKRQDELRALEEYMQVGTIIGEMSDARAAIENNTFQETRYWEQASLYRRVKKMRAEGMSYEDIAAHFNKIFESNRLPYKKVAATRIRQVIARGNKRLAK